MTATTCIEFLEWALPRLGLSWPGFRRVHHQVCKRISHRLQELRLPDQGAYRHFLETHPEEWATLDSFCRIPISRLMRDRVVFDRLASEVLPALAAAALARNASELGCWSAGCASGEEPYSLSILWQLDLASRFPALSLHVLATDIDENLLARAQLARYRRSSLRELPAPWIAEAFTRSGEFYEVQAGFRTGIEFLRQDIRETLPPGPFDLVLCRNLVFTYFDDRLQRRTLTQLLALLRPGAALVIGLKERLPAGVTGLEGWAPELGIYRRPAAAAPADLLAHPRSASLRAAPGPASEVELCR